MSHRTIVGLSLIALLNFIPSSINQLIVHADLAAPTVGWMNGNVIQSMDDLPASQTVVISADKPTDARSPWLGQYQPVSGQCTPSSTCCCSNGQSINVIFDSTTSTGLVISGGSDGGAGVSFVSDCLIAYVLVYFLLI